MSDDIQALVDSLAAELQRPTGVDDRHFRAVAYSSHPDRVDSVRLASILQRRAPEPVREWLEQLGVQEADHWVRIPANPGLGMSARVCMPLSFDSLPLGYLWLIDEPQPLTEEQLEEAARYADEFGVALHRSRLLERDDRRRERELVGRLLGLQGGDPARAADELLRVGHLVRAPAYVVMVAAATGPGGDEASDAIRVRVIDSAEHLRRAVAPHHLTMAVDGAEVIVVLACVAPGESARRAELLAEGIQTAEGQGDRALVGVSDERAVLTDLAVAYQEARDAGQVAARIGCERRVARWDELGSYRTVVRMLADRDPHDLIPVCFSRLLGSGDAAILIETLEHYLDHGGDARAAADLLYIHRSSLYGRLHRIEELAGVDLHSGDDRLELHLGLRLWRLGGSRIAD